MKFLLNPTYIQKLMCLVLVVGVLAACSPVTAQRGNLLETFQLEQIKTGQHSKSDVMKILGSPTAMAPFDENVWYYIGQETEKRGILDPAIVKERVVEVIFSSEDGLVQRVADIDEERVQVPYADDKTPTFGNDMSAIQQILGNIGRFNPQEANQ